MSTLSKNEQIIVDFWEKGWRENNVEYIISCFSDDISFVPAPPVDPIVGIEKVSGLIHYLVGNTIDFSFEFGEIAGKDDIVFIERFEHSRNHSDNQMKDYNVVGLFKLNKEGKIIYWIDYIDTPMASD